MQNLKFILLCLNLCFCTSLLADLQSDVVIQTYYSEGQSYIELYSYIINPYKEQELTATRNIESLVVISDESEIIVAEKYLYSFAPDQKEDIVDLKRFQLLPGTYTVRIEMLDLDDIELFKDHSIALTISEQQENQIAASDMFLGFQSANPTTKLEKAGVPMEPMVFDFCRNQKSIIAYTEFYNLDRDETNLFVGFKLFRKYSADSLEMVFKKYEILKHESYFPVLVMLPMEDVLSGVYQLSMDVTNKKSELILSQSREFTVSNAQADISYEMSYNSDFGNSWVQDLDEHQLDYALKAIFPRLSFTTTDVLNYVLRQNDLKVKRYFLYNFWVGQSEVYPQQLYNRYMEIAAAVDKTYQRNVGFGFESDRGFIFLKYGKPNNIIRVEDEPTAPPYEIWIYNYIEETKQTDMKFLFYNQSLAGNDMILLHSTVRGEYNNPRWELELYGNDPNTAQINPIDGRNATPGLNRRAREYFTDF